MVPLVAVGEQAVDDQGAVTHVFHPCGHGRRCRRAVPLSDGSRLRSLLCHVRERRVMSLSSSKVGPRVTSRPRDDDCTRCPACMVPLVPAGDPTLPVGLVWRCLLIPWDRMDHALLYYAWPDPRTVPSSREMRINTSLVLLPRTAGALSDSPR